MRAIRTLCGAALLAVTLAAPADALQMLPASGEQANDRLAASPRQAEWVTIQAGDDSVRAWVVYPERRENAPAVEQAWPLTVEWFRRHLGGDETEPRQP